MAMTVLSTPTPYCSAEDLFVWHDQNQCADCLRDGNLVPRPTIADMTNPNSTAGAILARIILGAAGRIEATCLVGKRYQPLDLQALAATQTAGAMILQKLNADIAFWMVLQRRQPAASDPKNVPGAAEAYEFLKLLAEGENIFGFQEAAEAGLPSVVPANPPALYTPNAVARAYRLFPTFQLGNNRQQGSPSTGGGS